MTSYLTLIIGFYLTFFFLDLIVNGLNIKAIKTQLPHPFEGFYDNAKYKKSQNYLKENTVFSALKSIVSCGVFIPFILLGGFNWIDQVARSFQLQSIATGLIFFGILSLGSLVLALPSSLYQTFVIEKKYGFNTTTLKTFILDTIKSILIGIILGTPIMACILWFFEATGPQAWLYCWAATTLFQVVIMVLAPIVIMPLFNKFVPLEEGDLKEAILSYAKKENFSLKGLFTMDGSKRSKKSNAFFTGLGRFRRIVLFDTLIENHSNNELLSIIAHEMGHYKKKHIIKSVSLSILSSGLMFYILSLFINNPDLFNAFKMQELSIYASLVFFSFLYSPIAAILSIFSNILSRKHEFEADAYAVQSTQLHADFVLALKKLSTHNLSNLTPHPLKVFLEYSHPPVLQRIKAIESQL